MHIGLYSCPIIMEFEFSRKVLEEYSNIKFHESVQWEPSCSMLTDGRTNRYYEANNRFSQFCERA